MPAKMNRIIFVDTNIWLDFYRSRNDAGIALLRHLEAIADRVVVSYQLEAEYKKNRQAAILEGLQDLKSPSHVPRPALFSDAKDSEILNRHIKEADKRVRALKAKLVKALAKPSTNDPVYQACQRIFHSKSPLILTREDKLRHTIRRKAFRRFLHGCPPRKKTDTSIGDAFNWEWMVHCAKTFASELVIVSRDSDYGVQYDSKAYINDHLRQEFSERVSSKRSLLLYSRLSEALMHFDVSISEEEAQAEADIVSTSKASSISASSFTTTVSDLESIIKALLATQRSVSESKPTSGA